MWRGACIAFAWYSALLVGRANLLTAGACQFGGAEDRAPQPIELEIDSTKVVIQKPAMREIVLDTNVLVAAFRSKRGASYQVVQSIGRGDWRLNISVALALEYEDVLKRKDVVPGITEAEVEQFLDYVFRASKLVPFVLRRRPSLRDPDDERILEVLSSARR